MSERTWFIPGQPGVPESPLARYRPAQPVGAVDAYVRRLTQPGDLVVDLFCQGPAVVREAVTAGRRALGISINPLLLVAARLGLSQRDASALNTAATHLADIPKGDIPLYRYMASLYRSACPVCGASGVAVWFAWDRDGNYPFEKAVRCPRCEEVQEGTPDDEDLHAVHRIPPRGLAYYYALDRVAPPGNPARERAAELVELYTPRNLSALMDLSLRLEGLETSEEVRIALTGVLLDCFDAGSSLDPYDDERPRPRTLRVPSRYLERNVWLCFEERLSRLLAEESPSPALPLPPAPWGGLREGVPQAPDVATLVRGEAGGYALVSQAARDVGEIIPPGSAALIFADPPRPDGVFWALSALWAGWLWESPPACGLRPFLRRRRFDWNWHWHVLRTALKAAKPLLTTEGHLITLFSDPQDVNDALLESVCLAASGAGYVLEGWGYSPEVGYRLVWRWEGTETTSSADVEALERDLIAEAEESVVSTLRKRGEPADWTLLHGSVYTRLAERGLLARTVATLDDGDDRRAFTFAAGAVRRAFESAPVVRLADREEADGALWWLAAPSLVAEPAVSPSAALRTGPSAALRTGPSAEFTPGGEELRTGGGEPLLADRVEVQVWELLAQPVVSPSAALRTGPSAVLRTGPSAEFTPRGEDLRTGEVEPRPAWRLEELVDAVYARFPGPLTPDLTLVLGCIDSYSIREGETLHLRPEDDPLRRAAELKTLRDDMVELGKRLGFEVRRRSGWDVRWLEEGREAYLFAISATVDLGLHLLPRRAADEGAQRCLVVPGGRARLVGLKLQRDPRLARAVEADGWQFIKFRHLRRLVAEEEMDRHALKTVLGLDPLVEQEAAQIPLF